MQQITRFMLRIAVVCACVAGAQPAVAQNVTTGDLVGVVMDAQKAVLPGSSVVALHVPTGTTYETTTKSDGRFAILAVRVGGPYKLTASMSGFTTQELTGIVVGLGTERSVEFTLTLASVQETVNVVAAAQSIDTARAGTASNVDLQAIESLPTIARSIADIARIRPMFNSMGGSAGDGASVVSVAGTSFRYNNLQIDGAANNDLFGLASSAGAPGGTAETQPISLDAIAELQLVVSPYDVRQGGFAGGGINAITKSGTNQLHGSGFLFGRNQNWVGKLNPANVPTGGTAAVSTFKDMQGGVSIGGPIIKNKAFFFGTIDFGRKQRPAGMSVATTGNLWGNEALVDQFLNDLKTLYGYSPGADPKAEFIRKTESNKYFIRTDFNLANNHQLTVRTNLIKSLNDIGSVSTSTFRMPDAFYRYISDTSSSVAQLNSTWAKGVNELRVTYTRVRDHRDHAFDQPAFPQVTVTVASGRNVVAGTEQFSARNQINQDIIELNESFTMIKGRHTVTVGSHNEFLRLKNLFIRDNFGTYNFSSLANFEAGFAQQYDRSFSATSDPLQAAQFGVNQWGLYAGDQWRVRNNFTLTYGFRVDAPRYPTKPNANPLAVSAFGYATNVVPNDVQWSPRVGFNWNTRGGGEEQIRGGLGMFTGRPAYVWISNQFGNTGIDFTRIGASFNTNNRIPFVANPLAQPATVTGATGSSFSNEIDVINPNFKYPSVLRGNLGWDRKLPWGMVGTAEFLWSRTLRDIKYQNLNFAVVPGVTGFQGRPFFSRVVTTLSDVILLENTNQGYNWNFSYEVRKPVSKGFFMSASYSYGVAKTIMDGTSDQAASNWGNVYTTGSSNNVPLARSNFDPGHRMNATAGYDVRIWKGYKATISMFYSGQTGRPFALTTNRDVNGDNRGTNDLLYIPASASEMFINGGTYQNLMDFINADSCLAGYVGKIIPRNACRGPWINTLDARLNLQLPLRKVKAEITLDVLNVLNLLNTKSGIIEYMSFGQLTAFTPVVTSTSTGLPVTGTPTLTQPLVGYDIASLLSPTFKRYLRDDLRSRWQIQLGARIRF